MAERPTEKTLRDVILDLKSKLLKSNLQNERLQLELYDVKRELENTRAEFLNSNLSLNYSEARGGKREYIQSPDDSGFYTTIPSHTP